MKSKRELRDLIRQMAATPAESAPPCAFTRPVQAISEGAAEQRRLASALESARRWDLLDMLLELLRRTGRSTLAKAVQ